MSKRKFYRTVLTIEILSEGKPAVGYSMKELAKRCEYGDFSDETLIETVTEVTAAEMAQLLVKQDSGSEFFDLDEDGNDLKDEGK